MTTTDRVSHAGLGLVRVPHKYAPDEVDLVLHDGNRKIIFTLAGGKISEISTGLTPEIDLVERCS